MSVATPADVAVHLLRELDPEEEAAAQVYLNVVEIIIKNKIPTFDLKIVDSAFRDSVVFVEATIVANVLRNPDRYQYEQAGDYAYSLKQVTGTDSLEEAITTGLWRLLGVVQGGAFTIDTAYHNDRLTSPRWWVSGSEWV